MNKTWRYWRVDAEWQRWEPRVCSSCCVYPTALSPAPRQWGDQLPQIIPVAPLHPWLANCHHTGSGLPSRYTLELMNGRRSRKHSLPPTYVNRCSHTPSGWRQPQCPFLSAVLFDPAQILHGEFRSGDITGQCKVHTNRLYVLSPRGHSAGGRALFRRRRSTFCSWSKAKRLVKAAHNSTSSSLLLTL